MTSVIKARLQNLGFCMKGSDIPKGMQYGQSVSDIRKRRYTEYKELKKNNKID